MVNIQTFIGQLVHCFLVNLHCTIHLNLEASDHALRLLLAQSLAGSVHITLRESHAARLHV